MYCIQEKKYNAEVFLNFLKEVLAIYSECKIVMSFDNAKIHHAKLIQPFLQQHEDRLRLVFLPTYSPELNLIEGLW